MQEPWDDEVLNYYLNSIEDSLWLNLKDFTCSKLQIWGD